MVESEEKFKKIGPYSLTKELGFGTFSRVYKAISSQDNLSYAIKMIPTDNLTKDQLISIENEVNILKQLKHKNIIQLFDERKTSNNK